jgi:hypothetical protein
VVWGARRGEEACAGKGTGADERSYTAYGFLLSNLNPECQPSHVILTEPDLFRLVYIWHFLSIFENSRTIRATKKKAIKKSIPTIAEPAPTISSIIESRTVINPFTTAIV